MKLNHKFFINQFRNNIAANDVDSALISLENLLMRKPNRGVFDKLLEETRDKITPETSKKYQLLEQYSSHLEQKYPGYDPVLSTYDKSKLINVSKKDLIRSIIHIDDNSELANVEKMMSDIWDNKYTNQIFTVIAINSAEYGNDFKVEVAHNADPEYKVTTDKQLGAFSIRKDWVKADYQYDSIVHECMHKVQAIIFNGLDFLSYKDTANINQDHGIQTNMEFDFYESTKASLINILKLLKHQDIESFMELSFLELIRALQEDKSFILAGSIEILKYMQSVGYDFSELYDEEEGQYLLDLINGLQNILGQTPLDLKNSPVLNKDLLEELIANLVEDSKELFTSELEANCLNLESFDVEEITYIVGRIFNYATEGDGACYFEFIPRVVEMMAKGINPNIMAAFDPMFAYWDKWIEPEIELWKQMHVEHYCSDNSGVGSIEEAIDDALVGSKCIGDIHE